MSRQLNDQLPVDFLAPLVDLGRALQRYCIGQGFESPTSQIFFLQALFSEPPKLSLKLRLSTLYLAV